MKKKSLRHLFVALVVFNMLFPKAGIKLSGIPLTIGNVVFFIALFFLLKNIKKVSFGDKESIILLIILFWLLRLFIGFSVDNHAEFSMFVGYFVPLCVYPLVYFVYKFFLDENLMKITIKWVRISVWGIISYGLLQFIVGIGPSTIPGITVNLSDYMEAPLNWWMQKFNGISSDSSKVVSTYQNGNLFGANLLLLFPCVYQTIYKKNIKILFLMLSLLAIVLAGSRSMYVALCIYCMFYCFRKAKFASTLRIRKVSIFTIISFLGLAVTSVYFFLRNSNASFIERVVSITDSHVLSSGTGRFEMFIKYLEWLYSEPTLLYELLGAYGTNYSGGAYEILYASLFVLGGLLGLVFTMYCFFKILYTGHTVHNKLVSGINTGLFLYALAACSEGAFWIPPLALNLWMIIAIRNYIIQNNYNINPCVSPSIAVSPKRAALELT